jgi:uncharacterized protein YbjT (DUF2867 family)
MSSIEGKKGKIAAVFGATGLVGEHVVRHLLENPVYQEVRVFVRHDMPWTCPEIRVVRTQFDDFEQIGSLLNVDEVFCCIGNTRHKISQFQSFVNVDFELPVRIAIQALKHGVDGFFVVSSLGANKRSHNYYLRTKGRLEEYLIKSGFKRLGIFRPALLLGARRKIHWEEFMAKIVAILMYPFMRGPVMRYRAINADVVARAMVAVANTKYTKQIFESEEIFKIGNL